MGAFKGRVEGYLQQQDPVGKGGDAGELPVITKDRAHQVLTGGEAIPEGGFRADYVQNNKYVSSANVDLAELQKTRKIVLSSPNKEVMFALFGPKTPGGDREHMNITKIIRLGNNSAFGGGVDYTGEQINNEVERLKNSTGLEFKGLGHSHLVNHPDDFSQYDLQTIEGFRKTRRNHVHMLFKIRGDGGVNVQGINNIGQKITINQGKLSAGQAQTAGRRYIQQPRGFIPGQGGTEGPFGKNKYIKQGDPDFIPGQGGNETPPGGFGPKKPLWKKVLGLK